MKRGRPDTRSSRGVSGAARHAPRASAEDDLDGNFALAADDRQGGGDEDEDAAEVVAGALEDDDGGGGDGGDGDGAAPSGANGADGADPEAAERAAARRARKRAKLAAKRAAAAGLPPPLDAAGAFLDAVTRGAPATAAAALTAALRASPLGRSWSSLEAASHALPPSCVAPPAPAPSGGLGLAGAIRAALPARWKALVGWKSAPERLPRGAPAVLVVTHSAARAGAALRGLAPFRCRALKLFPKAGAAAEAALVGGPPTPLAVGTPARVLALLASAGLSLARLELLVLDVGRGPKGETALTPLPDGGRGPGRELAAEAWRLLAHEEVLARLTSGAARVAFVEDVDAPAPVAERVEGAPPLATAAPQQQPQQQQPQRQQQRAVAAAPPSLTPGAVGAAASGGRAAESAGARSSAASAERPASRPAPSAAAAPRPRLAGGSR